MKIIRLLGPPSIEVDGVRASGPRGRKTWAVLAFLALTERPPSRQRVASLLFDGADDPLGALRWSLTELRKVIGSRAAFAGDPLELALPDDVVLDVATLSTRRGDGAGLTEGAGELLEGMSFPGCDAFESWLLVERRRQGALVEALLHETALIRLGGGRPAEAVRLASRAVELNPFEENHQTLLVRALAASGERDAALRAADACTELFRRELGIEPSPAVRTAAHASAGSSSMPPLAGAAAARAQLEAGSAAIAAGATDAGLDCLRRAVDEARFAADEELLITALTELGGALVHSVRGRDEEGASVLHEAVERADHAASPSEAKVCRELGFVDVQAGRRERAMVWLTRARAAATARGDDVELAAIGGVLGMSLSDQARYPEALATLTDSVERALSCDSRRQAAWSASQIGRLHLLRAEHDLAETALRQSLDLVKSERWLAFLPWPESFSAELDLLDGQFAVAEERLNEAFALACQLGDPCWEGISQRALGLLQARTDPGAALARLSDARARCVRWPDAYQWLQGYVLEATCRVAVAAGDASAARFTDDLLVLAARTDMRELISRAHAHRAALGMAGAAEAAQLAAADIDNPSLQALTEGAVHVHAE
jgi:DNA-binding SARP family transcriptional activator